LLQQQKRAEAEEALRKVADLEPDSGLAHLNLGIALLSQAEFHEAAASLKRAVDLLPPRSPNGGQARTFLERCKRYAALSPRLPAILQGTEKAASAAEQFDLAGLCSFEKNHLAAARFYRAAFSAEPKLAENVPEDTRYNAACAAALAGCGQGKGAEKLDERERSLWRKQALDWLRQDLAWWGKALDRGDGRTSAQVQQRMQRWQTDRDFEGVRARDALARLPDEERKQWERLWSDVDALLGRANSPASPPR
jgi:tetratricopeptide (TPR) repeat protein